MPATKNELEDFDKRFQEKYGRGPLDIQTQESKALNIKSTTPVQPSTSATATKTELDNFDKKFREKYGRNPLNIQTTESRRIQTPYTTHLDNLTQAGAASLPNSSQERIVPGQDIRLKPLQEQYDTASRRLDVLNRHKQDLQNRSVLMNPQEYKRQLDETERQIEQMKSLQGGAANQLYYENNQEQLDRIQNSTTAAIYEAGRNAKKDQQTILQLMAPNAQNQPGYTEAVQKISEAYGVSPQTSGTDYQQRLQELYNQLEDTRKKSRRSVNAAGFDYDRLEEYEERIQADAENAKARENVRAFAKEHPVAASALSVAVQPAAGLDYLQQVIGNLGRNDAGNLDTYRPMSADSMTISNFVSDIRGSVSEEIEKNTDWDLFGQNVASFLYQTGMSVADSALMIGAMGNGASLLMGLSAASQTASDALSRGATNGQAVMAGFAAGAAEMLFEKFSIDQLLKPKSVTSVKRLLQETMKQAGVEASEEGATEIANILTDAAIMGESSNFSVAVENYKAQGMSESEARKQAYLDMIGQVGWAAAGGALSGGVMGGVVNTARFGPERRAAKAVKSETNRLNETAQDIDEDIRPERQDPAAQTPESVEAYQQEISKAMDQQEQRLRQQARQASQEANGQEQQTEQPNVTNTNSTSGLVWAGSERNTASSAQHIEQLAGQLPAHAAERFRRLAQGMPETSLDGLYQSFLDAYYSAGTEAGGLSLSDPVQQEARRAWQEDREEADQAERIVQGLGEQGRAAYLSGYTPGVNAVPYNTGFSRAYEQGLVGGTADGRNTQAYTAGRQDAAASLAREQARVSDAVRYGAQSGLVESEYNAGLRRQERRVLDQFAKDLGVQVQIEAPAGGRANGWFQDGVVHIAADTENPILVVGAHEITHRMQELAPEEYRRYRDYAAGAALAEMEDLVDQYRDRYAKAGVELSTEEAMDEIAADYTRRMVEQPELFEQMARDDRSLARRVLDALLDFLERIRARFSSQQSRNEASQAAYGADLKTLEEAARLWQRAYDAASRQAAGQTENASRQGGAARYSLRTVDGKNVVWIENSSLTNKELNNHKAVADFIAQHIGEVYTIIESGQKVYIGPDLPGEYTQSRYTSYLRNTDRAGFRAKRKAIDGLGELIETATNRRWEQTRHTQSKDAKYGMYRYDSTFAFPVKGSDGVVQRVRAYDAELLIRNASDGKKYLYDIVNLKENTSAQSDLTAREARSAAHKTATGRGVSEDSIPRTGEEVKARFSLKEPVEETKDLIALHNLTESELLGSLRLGGFPMPSIAITRADIPHTNFGEISLVMDKRAIDPKTSRKNTVYSADAWTPTFPQVEYEADMQAERRISRRIGELSARVAPYFQDDLRRLQYGLDDDLNRHGGEEGLARWAMDNYGLKAAYLEEQGTHIEPSTTQREVEKGYNPERADKYQAIADALGTEDPDTIGSMNLKELREQHGEALEAAFPGMTKSAFRMSSILRQVQEYFRDQGGEPVYETVTDGAATRRAVDEALDRAEYEQWVRELYSGIEAASGVYNNKERFTPSGNRRSFQQTHYPVTLEGIVKAMAGQNGGSTKNVSGFHGVKSLRAGTAQRFKSIADMHKLEGRLQNLTEAEQQAISDALDERLIEITRELAEKSPGGYRSFDYMQTDAIGNILMEIAESGTYTIDSIMRTLNEEYQYHISNELAAKIRDLLFDVSQMPVNLFEAKPERAVSFDEVLAAVVPEGSSRALLDALEQAGVQTLEYRSGDDADRLEKVNSVEEARFSLRGGDILHESAELRREEQQLQQRFASLQREKGRQRAGNSTIQRVARDLRQIIGSGTELNELTERVRAIYDGIVSGALDYSQARGQALELGQELVENAVMADDTLYREYADLRKFLRDTRIQVSETDSHDIPDYNTFRRHNFGRLRLAKGRTNIDQIYQELSENWPGLFDERRHSVPMDQLMHISEVLDDIYARPSYNPYSQDLQQAAEGAANEIFGHILNLSGAEATARSDSEQMIRRAIERERTTREELIELSGRYGRMEPGERPFRDITIPRKTGENMLVSRTVRTALEAEATPDELVPDIEQLVADGAFSYEAYSDEQAKKDAEQRIQEIKFEADKTEWERAIQKGRPSKFNTALGWTLYNEAANSGKTEAAIQILTEMVGYQRDHAQALQAARILKQFSPDAQLYSATKAASDIQRDLDERHSRGNQYKLREESETAKRVGEAIQGARSDAAKALRNGDETFEQAIERELNRLFRRRKDKDAQTEAAKKDIALKVSEIVSDRNARKSARDAVISMLIEKYGVSEADTAAAAQIVGERFDTLVQESMQKRLDSIFKERQRPKRRTIQQRFEELANLGAFASEQYNEMAARRIVGDVPGIRIDPAMAEEFLNARTQDERDAIMKRIYMDIGRQMPSNFLDKWNAWRYFAMLANPRTHIRNIAGNTFFVPVVAAKNLTATAIESAVHFVSGGRTERGKAFVGASKSDRALLSAAWNDFSKVEDVISGVGKYEDSVSVQRAIQEGRRIFQSNKRLLSLIARPMEAARRGAGNLLTLEDMWFSKPHYAYALAQYCKAHGITEADIRAGNGLDAARAYAIKEAQKATYRDANMLSHAISGLGRYHGENPGLRAGSMLMDGILPFRSTPANILARGLEYSPAGLLNGIKQVLWDVRRGNMTATQAIDSISAGLTGSGLLALGLWMAAQGLIRGHGSDDEEEEAFLEMLGHQQYALEIGGNSYTLDWLAPEALPLFMGVNAYETMQQNGEFNMAELIGVLTRIGEPMMQMSFLQSFNDAFDAVKYAANRNKEESVAALADAATSYLMQGFPSFLGQIERASQADRMTTYTNPNAFLTTDMQYTLGSISARVPGVDYQQIPYIDAWGRKETEDSTAIRVRDNMFNPSYTDSYGATDLEAELLRLYDAVGSSAVFPERADKSFKVNGENLYLDADQYVKYATEKGKGALELATKIYESAEYKLLDDETKVEVISDAYAYANAIAKTKVSEYEPDGWVANALESGMKPEDYIIANARLDNMSSFNAMIESGIDSETAFTVAQAISSLEPEKGEETVSSMQKYKAVLHENLEEAEKVEALEYLMPNGTAEKFSTAVSYGITSEQYVDYMEHADANGNSSVTQKEAQNMISSISGLSQQQRAVLWQLQNKSWKSENNPFGYSGIQQEPESGGLTLGGGGSTTERTTQSTNFGQLILGGNRR